MKRSVVWTLTRVEQEIVAEVRGLRAAPRNAQRPDLLGNPARLVHHLVLSRHGNVQLRLAPIAREIGVEMRTLERAFAIQYGCTMATFQQGCRLSCARRMLTTTPPIKVGVIAISLGYEHLQDFNRFFKKHMSQTPSVWGRKERERMAPAHLRRESEAAE